MLTILWPKLNIPNILSEKMVQQVVIEMGGGTIEADLLQIFIHVQFKKTSWNCFKNKTFSICGPLLYGGLSKFRSIWCYF